MIKRSKKLALGDEPMYKIKSKQIRFEDFYQPVGLKMDPNNRWIKKAEMIPWDAAWDAARAAAWAAARDAAEEWQIATLREMLAEV